MYVYTQTNTYSSTHNNPLIPFFGISPNIIRDKFSKSSTKLCGGKHSGANMLNVKQPKQEHNALLSANHPVIISSMSLIH